MKKLIIVTILFFVWVSVGFSQVEINITDSKVTFYQSAKSGDPPLKKKSLEDLMAEGEASVNTYTENFTPHLTEDYLLGINDHAGTWTVNRFDLADLKTLFLAGNADTATALAANGADCSAGSYPLGVDASGAVANCTDATTEIDSAIATHASAGDPHTGYLTEAAIGTPYDTEAEFDALFASKLSLSGGTMTGELVADNLGIEFTAGDDHSDCTAFSATGGGLFFDDSEGIFKKCQDNVLTDLDTGGAETNSLESTVTGIADTEIFVGDGADSGAFVVVSGDATLANTGALTVGSMTLTDNESTNENNPIWFSAGAAGSGSVAPEADGDVHYNPSTGTVTATEFVGGGSGLTGIDAATGDSATAFFDAGEIEEARIHADIMRDSEWTQGTSSAQGKLELAIDSEAVTGTDTERAVTPANLTARLAAPGAIGGTTPATSLAVDAITVSSSTDPFWTFDVTDADDTDWTIGTNADADASSDDDFEFRTSPTPGSLVHSWLEPDTGDVVYEGATDNAYSLKFDITDPTANRTVTFDNNNIDFSHTTEDWVLTYNASTRTWAGEAATGGSDDQTLAEVLASGADANDVDTTSWGLMSGFDTGLYLDWDADGVIDLTSDGTLELHSADWDIGATGIMTGMGAITSDGDITTTEDLLIGDNKYIGSASDPDAMQIENDGDIIFTQDVAITGTIVNQGGINLGTGGVVLTDDGDGQLTITGAGDGNDENLTINLDDTANTVVVNTSTGVTLINLSAIGIETTGTITAGTSHIGPLLDAAGNEDMDYGSADVDDHTFTTDGTGDAEFVVPNDSIGNAELDWGSMTDLTTDGALGADVVDEAHIADNGIDSEHYNDGSIDNAHLAVDIITADEMADADHGDVSWSSGVASVESVSGEVCAPPVIFAEPDELQPISDAWPVMHFPAEQYPSGVTITAIHIQTSATCTDVLNFEEWALGATATSSTVESITLSGTSTEDDGTLADADMAADGNLYVDFPATPTDIAFYMITVCYTRD